MKQILRVISGLCLAGVLGLRLYESFPLPDRFWTAFALLGAMAVAGAVFFLTLRCESRLLARGTDLLVPFGFLAAAFEGIGWLWGRPGMEWFLRPILEFGVGPIDVSVNPMLLVLIVLHTFYLSWVSLLVWRAVRGEDVSASATFGEGIRRFPAALAAGAFGTVGFLLLMAPMLSWIGDLPPRASPALALLLFPAGLAVNLVTAALALEVLSGRGSSPAAFARGLREGARRPMRWGLPIAALMILLGGLWIVPFDYTSREVTTTLQGSEYTETISTTNRSGTNYGSHVSWTGGYENDTEWDDEVAEVWGTSPVPAVSFLLGLLLAALAILVKLRIARKLEPGPPPLP